MLNAQKILNKSFAKDPTRPEPFHQLFPIEQKFFSDQFYRNCKIPNFFFRSVAFPLLAWIH